MTLDPKRDGQRLLFVCGLHRSGTSPLVDALAERPEISTFQGTGVPEDEGQFLQSVYPPAFVWGGPGRFALNPESHFTESSPLATPENAEKMLQEWSRHWDLARPILMEKSPPDLTKTRFLRTLFPGCKFLVIARHPIAVALATSKWSAKTFFDLIEHWIVAHETFREDARGHADFRILAYEHLVDEPDRHMRSLHEWLGLEACSTRLKFEKGPNARYFAIFREAATEGALEALAQRFETRLFELGYSFRDLEHCDPETALASAPAVPALPVAGPSKPQK